MVHRAVLASSWLAAKYGLFMCRGGVCVFVHACVCTRVGLCVHLWVWACV